jgi:putative N6-adenine-specific DNA methylase
MKKFFVVCPLHQEMALAAEIRACWPLLIGKDGQVAPAPSPALRILKGGVELECDEVHGYQLNFFLKTASRILLRLAEFKARDFPKVHEKIKALPWQEYFRTSRLEYVVAASRSRLNHEGRLRDTLEKTLRNLLPPAGAQAEGTVYLRMENDLCTLSLDTTGEHLHKRGWAPLKGEAPLRETLAQIILRQLIGDTEPEKLARIHLFDPMAGSGTFLLEARASHFPQWGRPFAFQKFKSCPKIFLSPSFIFNYRLPRATAFKSLIASDRDEKILLAAQKNAQSLEAEIARFEKKNYEAATWVWEVADLFADTLPKPPAGEELWIVSNPPYGERLRDSAEGDMGAYFAALAATKAGQIALLHPEKMKLKKAQVPAGYKISAEIPLLNGGLKTLLTVLKLDTPVKF